MANHVALRLVSGNFYLSAEGGGGRTTDPNNDPIHTDRKIPQGISDWEKFTLVSAGAGTYALMTFDGLHYVTADQGGGKSTDALNTDATAIGPWETFTLDFQNDGTYGIKTANGNYVSAVGARHKDAVRTVQTTVGAGEKFWIIVAMPL
jgi:hypothetical protein